jgi:nitrogen fixation protein FixH
VIRDSAGKTESELQQDMSDLKGQLTARYGPGVDQKGAVAWGWAGASGVVESKVVLELSDQPKKVVAILYSTKAALKRYAEEKLREKSNL